ncbi:MAG: amino acid adenylation domain-containing protein, partial [Marinifilaceae bacterium]
PLKLQYKDYSEWQQGEQLQKRIKVQEAYWLKRFEGELPVLNLPLDFVRPVMKSHEGATVSFALDERETESLRHLAQEYDLTLYMSLLSVFSILLSRLTGQESIVVGTPVVGRNHADLEGIVGVFVNTLAMRNEVKREDTLRTFLRNLRENTLAAYDHQDYQFEDLVEQLGGERDTSRHPVFDVMFNLLNQSDQSRDLSGFSHHEPTHRLGISKFDLTLNAVDCGEQLLLSFNYCTKLFRAATINRYIVYFRQLVEQLTSNQNQKLSGLQMISKEEKYQLLFEFNDTKLEFSRAKSIHQLFEEQVVKTPDNIAIVFGEEQISYSELNKRSNRLARYLVNQGVLKESYVGVLIDRSIELYIALLGILKTGRAYIPIDPTIPESRIEYLVKDSDVKIVLTDRNTKLPGVEKVINYSLIEWNCSSVVDLKLDVSPTLPAYVIYTSGSTGVPKGVVVNHRNVVNLFCSQVNEFGVKKDERIFQFSTISFDASVEQICLALLTGATLVGVEKSILQDMKQVEKLLCKQLVTHLHSVPSYLNDMDFENLKDLRRVLAGGDRFPKELVSKLEGYLFYNKYGPTETTVTSTELKVTRGVNELGILSIGKPLANTQVYILDKLHNLQPIGVPGELCISGEGVANGYLNNPALTAEKFIVHPFIKGERLYRTGDLARWLPDGNLEFLGRIDHQVKIRGFRIELGEIENILLQHENVTDCVVTVCEESAEKSLCAYVVLLEVGDVEELRSYLSGFLPDYMVPSYFMKLDVLPHTNSGKVNRKALPALEIKAGDNYVGPSNDLEERMVTIWSEVLGVAPDVISVTANFFAIGGHSLKASVLTGRIHREIGVKFPLRDVFIYSTIREQVNHIHPCRKSDFISIPHAPIQDYYPLSSAQKRLFLLHQMEPGSIAYNMPYTIPLDPEIDKCRIEDVFRQIISRHESFRTSFDMRGDVPVQRIEKQVSFKMEELTIENSDGAKTRETFVQPFDLSKAPLLRVLFVEIKKAGNLLLIDMPHIISDGISHSILEREFYSLYLGEELSPLRLQYKDYSEWQNSEEQQVRVKEQEDYWLKRFVGEIPILNLPTDYIRPAIQSYDGATVRFALSKNETELLKTLARENDLTLFMSLLSVFTILLSRMSDQERIVVGTPVSGRNHADLEGIVGMFVNTLAIENEVKGVDTLKEFVARVKQNSLDAFENQDYQFEELVEKLMVTRDTSRNPVFDVVFNMSNQSDHSKDLSGFNHEVPVHTPGISKFDLTLSAVDCGDQLLLSLNYCTKLFKAATIDRYISFFRQIVNQFKDKREEKLAALEIITKAEMQQILYEFNDTQSDYPKDKTIHDLFSQQAEKHPDNIALVDGNTHLSYGELNFRSDQFASFLRGQGVGEEEVVGVFSGNSSEVYIAVLGVLKSGGAYLPIDSRLPSERVKYILRDSNASVIIGYDIMQKKLAADVVQIELGDQEYLKHSKYRHKNTVQSKSLCYVIYTSGSTGTPKGVEVEHRSLVNLCFWHSHTFQVSKSDHVSQYAGFGFDASVWELFPTLINGASLYLVPESIRLDVNRLNAYYEKNDVTVSFLPTQVCEQFMHLNNQSLRVLLTGGDKLNSYQPCRYSIYNNYGPTESTVVATSCKVTREVKNIPIGRPVGNTQIYILGKYLELQGIGMKGELYIGGDGLARGYLGRKELSESRFIPHPFKEGERLYRTGDLACWLPDGNIEFLGRIDHQVKIRGFRIELGEIENVLIKHDNIKECVIVTKEKSGDKYLCAYVVWDKHIPLEELRNYLSGKLPDYMVPSYFVEMEELPITTNGKINIKALPFPEVKADEDFMAPSNKLEEKLVDIWSEVLKLQKEKISVSANFFNIGGHSLKLTLLISKIHKEFDVKLSFVDAYRYPVLSELAKVIDASKKDNFAFIANAEKRDYYPLTKSQRGIYFYQQLIPESRSYNIPMIISLGDDYKIDKIKSIFNSIMLRHECFRTSIKLYNDEPIQQIHDEVNFTLNVYDGSLVNQEEVLDEIFKPFCLNEAPLIRACVLKIPNKHAALIVNMHHVISDEFSLALLQEEFQKISEKIKVPPLKYQFKDFAVWQKNDPVFLKKQETHKKYWLTKFRNGAPELNLPLDHLRIADEDMEGERFVVSLTKEETLAIKQLALSQNTSVFITVLSLYYIWLMKISGDEDIVVGTPVSGRYHECLNKICGMFVNTLALRNYPSGYKYYLDFLDEIHRNVLSDFENQYFGFDELVGEIYKERKVGRNPIFDVFYSFSSEEVTEMEQLDEKVLKQEEICRVGVKFDFSLSGYIRNDQIKLVIDCKKSLFDRTSIEYYITILQKVIRQITTNYNVVLGEIVKLENEINNNIIASLEEDF